MAVTLMTYGTNMPPSDEGGVAAQAVTEGEKVFYRKNIFLLFLSLSFVSLDSSLVRGSRK